MAQELAEVPDNVSVADHGATGIGGFIGAIRSLEPTRIVALGIVTILLLGFFAYIIFRATTPTFAVLFSGMPIEDTQVVSERLRALGVDFRLGAEGDAILVPSDQVLTLRMNLASEGLPIGKSMGYELFDQSSSLTATDFISNVNLRRALEGELARTIMGLRQVRSARVHIVSPERQPFSRNQTRATASVVVGTNALERSQIDGIRNLVASAVPQMRAGDVSIIDANGNLLASPNEDSDLARSVHHEEQRIELENHLRRKIISLLERSVGRGRVDAQIFAQMDFDALTTTKEEFDPEGQVARSVQTIEENSDREETDQNQAVTVQNNLPAEDQDQAPGATSAERDNRSEESTNFEISRTVQSQSRVGGVVSRLSVAVQVDFREITNQNGDTVFEARDAEDLAQLEALVRSSVGFDEERGDWIEVVSRRFAPDDVLELEEASLFEFSREDYWRAAELLILAMLGVIGVLLGVRPLLSYTFKIGKKDEQADPNANLVEGILDAQGNPIPLLEDSSGNEESIEPDEIDELINVTGVDGKVRASLLDKLSEIIEKNPEAGIRVLRSWLHGG